MYRGFGPRCIFFAQFLEKTAKKFHFNVFFVVIYRSHLMHSVGAIYIMNHSN